AIPGCPGDTVAIAIQLIVGDQSTHYNNVIPPPIEDLHDFQGLTTSSGSTVWTSRSVFVTVSPRQVLAGALENEFDTTCWSILSTTHPNIAKPERRNRTMLAPVSIARHPRCSSFQDEPTLGRHLRSFANRYQVPEVHDRRSDVFPWWIDPHRPNLSLETVSYLSFYALDASMCQRFPVLFPHATTLVGRSFFPLVCGLEMAERHAREMFPLSWRDGVRSLLILPWLEGPKPLLTFFSASSVYPYLQELGVLAVQRRHFEVGRTKFSSQKILNVDELARVSLPGIRKFRITFQAPTIAIPSDKALSTSLMAEFATSLAKALPGVTCVAIRTPLSTLSRGSPCADLTVALSAIRTFLRVIFEAFPPGCRFDLDQIVRDLANSSFSNDVRNVWRQQTRTASWPEELKGKFQKGSPNTVLYYARAGVIDKVLTSSKLYIFTTISQTTSPRGLSNDMQSTKLQLSQDDVGAVAQLLGKTRGLVKCDISLGFSGFTVAELRKIIRWLRENRGQRIRLEGNKVDYIRRLNDTVELAPDPPPENIEVTKGRVLKALSTAARWVWDVEVLSVQQILNSSRTVTLRTPPDLADLSQNDEGTSKLALAFLRLSQGKDEVFSRYQFPRDISIHTLDGEFDKFLPWKTQGRESWVVIGTADDWEGGVRVERELLQESNHIALVMVKDKKAQRVISSIYRQTYNDLPKELVEDHAIRNRSLAFIPTDDLAAGDEKVSLRCALTLVRMRVPVKSCECQHSAAFDAEHLIDFLRSTEFARDWRCPLFGCAKNIAVQRLRVDPVLFDALKRFPDADMILLKADGTLSCAPSATPNNRKRDRGDSEMDQEHLVDESGDDGQSWDSDGGPDFDHVRRKRSRYTFVPVIDLADEDLPPDIPESDDEPMVEDGGVVDDDSDVGLLENQGGDANLGSSCVPCTGMKIDGANEASAASTDEVTAADFALRNVENKAVEEPEFLSERRVGVTVPDMQDLDDGHRDGNSPRLGIESSRESGLEAQDVPEISEEVGGVGPPGVVNREDSKITISGAKPPTMHENDHSYGQCVSEASSDISTAIVAVTARSHKQPSSPLSQPLIQSSEQKSLGDIEGRLESNGEPTGLPIDNNSSAVLLVEGELNTSNNPSNHVGESTESKNESYASGNQEPDSQATAVVSHRTLSGDRDVELPASAESATSAVMAHQRPSYSGEILTSKVSKENSS
ncbi:SUMO ligase siz1, partial [Gonapodya sp. JEL0774]